MEAFDQMVAGQRRDRTIYSMLLFLFDAFVQTHFLLKLGFAIGARAFLRPVKLSNRSQKQIFPANA